ncbi:unnamed protein product [[Candida] boidinii]|uniref:Unnamed protein product n=1 Tax=Candida boidinii TaxID=5477 RepID=A0ACB5TM36_CANBO|nr:unnamed protein product [[Candida] boidinii]
MTISKAIIMVGGDTRGTRFRPLSLDVPKILFPIAGKPLLSHIIDSVLEVESIDEIILIGFYETSVFADYIANFNVRMRVSNPGKKAVNIKYLKEFKALGTAGGLYHFRGEILKGNPESFFVIHGDIVCSFPFNDIAKFYESKKNTHKEKIDAILFGVKINNYELFAAINGPDYGSGGSSFGTIVTDDDQTVVHYVEKPESKISDIINGGIYLFNETLFRRLSNAKISKITIANDETNPESIDEDVISMEKDILHKLPDLGNTFVYEYKGFWKQIKTPSGALFANELYLDKIFQSGSDDFKDDNGEPIVLQKASKTISPPVYIHPSAVIHPDTKIGPYVSIGENVTISEGVRLSNTIILPNTEIGANSIILNSIVSSNCKVGNWCRVQGTGINLATINEVIRKNGGKSIHKLKTMLTNETQVIGIRDSGNICILGSGTTVSDDTFVLNSFILPNKSIKNDTKYEIVM